MCMRCASDGKQTSQRAINIIRMNVWIALRSSDIYIGLMTFKIASITSNTFYRYYRNTLTTSKTSIQKRG